MKLLKYGKGQTEKCPFPSGYNNSDIRDLMWPPSVLLTMYLWDLEQLYLTSESSFSHI